MATRRERVVLILDDKFSGGMTKAAGATALLNRELDTLGRNHKSLASNSVTTARAIDRQAKSIDKLGGSARRADRDLDRMSGRLKIIVQSATALSPALAPIATSLVPVVTGLATGLGFAAASAGTAVVALKGVGAALKTVETARLEPTVANLQAAAIAMQKLGPDGALFVKTLNDARPALRGLQMDARAGLLPGLGDSLGIILERGDQVGRILYQIGDATGDLFRNASTALASNDFDQFFTFIEREARPQLIKLGTTLGLVAKAGSDVFMALSPLTNSFGDGLLNAAEGLARAAASMDTSQGVGEFIAYVQATGPQVVDTFLALGNAVLQIGEAAAPLGGPVLRSVEGMANAIAAIADSSLGGPIVTLAVGMAALARASAVLGAASKGLATFGTALAAIPAKATAAKTSVAALGAMSAATMGVAAAAAIGIGAWLSYEAAQRKAREAAQAFSATLDQQTGAITSSSRENLFSGLESSGLVKAAKENGIAIDGLITSLISGGAAYEDYRSRVVAAGQATAGGGFAAAEYGAKLDDLRNSVVDGESRQKDLQSALGGTAGSFNATARTASRAASATERFTASVTAANRVLDKRSSLRDYQAAIDEARKSLKENGKTLDINTEKGRANQAALDDIAGSAVRAIENLNGTNRVRVLSQARRNLIDAAQQFGATRSEARRLADQLLKLDGLTVRTRVITQFSQSGNPVYSTGAGNRFEAMGGFYPRAYANGGMDRANAHKPQMARGGDLRIWAEPETKGETYIPHANDHRRPAAKTYLQKTAEMFGGSVEWYADGGSRGGGSGSSARRAASSLDKLSRASEKASKSLDKATTQRDTLLSRRSDIRSTVSGAFRTDQFATDGGDIWSDKARDPLSVVLGDTANAQKFKATLAILRKRGLSGKAYDDLASRGDLGAAENLASQSRSYLAQYETAFATRDRVTAAVGATTADSVVGDELRNANQELREIKKELKHIRSDGPKNAKATGDHVGQRINSAATGGHRDKPRHGGRN